MKVSKFSLIATTLINLVGNNLDAQETNYVLDFNGGLDNVNIGSNAASDIRSIEFWFKPSIDITPFISSDGYSLIVRNDDAQFNEFGFHFRGEDWPTGRGFMYFFMRDNGILHEIKSNSDSWTSDAWYHACGTIDSLNGMKFYINGVIQAMTDTLGTIAIPSSSEITSFGTWGNANIRYFQGIMDEVRFWNKTLSPDEILDNMCLPLTPSDENGLVGYWQMNEGTGITIFDATENENNGIIDGADFVEDNTCKDSVSSIPEINQISSFSIYPNPLIEECIIKIDGNQNQLTIIISNIFGQELKRINSHLKSEVKIEKGGFPSGLYFVSLVQNNKILAMEKLMIE